MKLHHDAPGRHFARCETALAGICLLLLGANRLQAAFTIDTLNPVSGKPGELVTISGQDFDPGATWTISLAGLDFGPQQVTASNITFVVPPAAASGTVTIDDGQQSADVSAPFEVTRDIPGILLLPAGTSPDGWSVVTGDSFSPVATNGSFTATVPLDFPAMVWAVRSGNDPAYLSLALPADASVTIDASSSAAALIYLVPGVAPHDPAAAPQIWQSIRQDPNLSAVVALIDAAAGHYDYLDDSRLEDREALVAQSVIGSSPTTLASKLGAFKSGTPPGTELLDLYPPKATLLHFDPVLESKLTVDSTDTNTLLFTYGEARKAPLDYIIDVYPLDPSQFSEGFSSVTRLTGQSNYVFYDSNPIPYATGFLRAKLFSKKLDPLGYAFDAVLAKLTGSLDAKNKPNQFEFPRSQNGVYVAQAYSGDVEYALDHSAYGQAAILGQIDPNHQWVRAFSENQTLAALDFASVFLDIKTLTGFDNAGYLDSLMKDTYKAALVYRENGGLTKAEVYDLTKTIASSIVKTYTTGRAKNALEASIAARLTEKAAAFVGNSLNVFKKVSSGAGAAERLGNLFSWDNLALEHALFVVGDPFVPQITRLEPSQGRESNSFQIFGNNLYVFGDPPPTVEFVTFQETSTNRENPPVSARLATHVVDARPNRIIAEVPSGWQSTFNTLAAYVCVTQAGKTNPGYSTRLGDKGLFHYLPPPEITDVVPHKILVGSHFVIKGSGFTPDCQVVVGGFYYLHPVRIDPDEIEVVFPDQQILGSQSLTIKSGAVESAPFTIEVGLPPYVPNPSEGGLDITVTKLDMSNVADGEVSLLEAFLIANGTLGRPIEVHLDCETNAVGSPGYCGGPQQRETDFVAGDNELGQGGGATYSDTIHIESSLHGSVVNLTRGLPAIKGSDQFYLEDLVLDGSGAPGGAVGLSFDGANDAVAQHFVFTNWPGTAVQIANQSHGNLVENFSVHGASGDGIFISNLCSNNTLMNLAIDNVAGTGIHLNGDCSRNQISQGVVNFPGQHGVQLESRCTLNELSGITIQGSGGDGVRIEAGSDNNYLSVIDIATATDAGLRIAGSSFNRMFSGTAGDLTDTEAIFHPHSRILNGQDWGIILEGGASNNVLCASVVGQNSAGGILVRGNGTDHNVFGKPYADHAGKYEIPIFPMIVDNGGPGIRIAEGASHNSMVCLNVAGNMGDGIEVADPGTDDNQLRSILTGFRYFIENSDPQPALNQGNSISITNGAKNTWITRYVHGAKNFSSDPDSFNTSLALDTGNGILIDGPGTTGTRVDSTTIGSSADTSRYFTNSVAGFAMYPVGSNGVVITGGASSNVIGKADLNDQVCIDACPQAAILIEGTNSDHNIISGCAIGNLEVYYDYSSDPASHCRYGILLKDGPKDNQIGQPGPMTGRDSFGFGAGLIDNVNRISFCDEAAIALDNCGGTIAPDGSRQQPNVLHNNSLYSDEVGILLTHGAAVNDIGGPLHGPRGFIIFTNIYYIDENLIGGCRTAGIRIHDNGLPDGAHQNLFENNSVDSGQSGAFTNSPLDPLLAPPSGVGLLIDGSSSNNIVGEAFGEVQNKITFCPAGVYINAANHNTVRGFDIEGYSSYPNGVVVREGVANQIGGDTWGKRNEIMGWGLSGAPDGDGVLLVGGYGNTVVNNLVKGGNKYGIQIYNSNANQIGTRAGQANQIRDNVGAGILLDQGSSANQIRGNDIDGNADDGIRFVNGAHDNEVGTAAHVVLGGNLALVPGANIIAHNGGAGVHVNGAAAIGNTLLNNSIYANSDIGILEESGGNEEIHPPTNMSFGKTTLVGHVADLAETPPGSVVQAFTDQRADGEVLLGQAIVKADGSWEMTGMSPAIYSNVTATVTSVSSGSTSEFALVSDTRAFSLARTDGAAPGMQSTLFGSGSIVVLPITATAVGQPVLVKSVTVSAGGSLADDTAVDAVRLYRDSDTNGVLGAADTLLGEAPGFDTDDGQAVITTDNLLVDPDVPQYWLVTYRTSQTVSPGTTFYAQITNASAVDAEYQFPIGQPAMALGAYPIRSDDFTVEAGTVHPFDAWRALHFPGNTNNPAISGAKADPDGDGIPNLLEYARGLDPNLPDFGNLFDAFIENDHLVLEFDHWKEATGIQIFPEASLELLAWNGGTPYFDQPPVITDNGDGYETIQFRTAMPVSETSRLFLRLGVELVASP